MTEGIFGLVGVVIGAVLAFSGQVWIEHRNRSRRAYYLAVRIVCILDEFIDDCLAAARDKGEYVFDQDHGYEERIPTAPDAKAPDWPADADWESFDANLMHRVLTFPALVKAAKEVISQTIEYVDDAPDHTEAFEETAVQHAALGRTAFQITKAIRTKYRIPESDRHDYEVEEAFARVEKKVAEDRQARHDRNAKMMTKFKEGP